MLNGLYHIIVIAVAVWGIISGYRRGFLLQIGKVIAVVFGIVAARLLGPECISQIDGAVPDFISGFSREFFVMTFTYGIIYVVIFLIVGLISSPLEKLFRVLDRGVFDSICGAAFRMFQYLILLSLAYNLIVDMNPTGELTRSSRLHDGNVVEGVMKIAPALLGIPDGEEVAHRQQLEDAKKIS